MEHFYQWRHYSQTILWMSSLAAIIGTLIDNYSMFLGIKYLFLIGLIFLMVFHLLLIAAGLVLKDMFGHRDLRSQLIAQGMWLTGLIGLLSEFFILALWNQGGNEVLLQYIQSIVNWLWFGLLWILFFTMVLVFLSGKERSSVPRGWVIYSLCVGIYAALGSLVGLLYPSYVALIFGVLVYPIWALWLCKIIGRIDRA